ncbi:MAG TPA: PA0069 family radical SAM protein [Woeseiaceae bacterium]|nr:PA0069 family radical SAM protein [Woeseiaceae bacterium]
MPEQPHKGRGAISRPAGRFAARTVDRCEEDAVVMAPETILRPMQARSIVSRNNSPDVPFERSINPYQGCEHGCVYCYARPSHSYLDLSPGLDFETQIFYKPNAVDLLLAEWSRPGYECKPITIGANTDPYQPAERNLGLTRRLLETFLEHRHPVSLISKGILMRRDLDLLGDLAALDLCSVAISVPTADNALKRRLEPRVPSADARFRLMRELTGRGVPTSLLMAPIIPAVNDHEIEHIVGNAAQAGAGHAAYVLLRLPHELKGLFADWLEAHLPDRAAHVMSLLRAASGGKDYDNRYGLRQTGRGPYADMIGQRFRAACRKYGISPGRNRQELDCGQFRRPGQQQLALTLG